MVIIPIRIKEYIEMIEEGKKLIKVPKEKQYYSQTQLLSVALRNLEFLNEIANTEPVYSFLEKHGRIIRVLKDFSTMWDPTRESVSLGALCLARKKEHTGLFFWLDADYPANRSDRDYTLITEENLNYWDKKSLEIFAQLTENEIWGNIDHWLKLRAIQGY